GIGRWTAEMFLIFRLGRFDVLPVDDYGLRKAVQRAYGLKGLPEARWLQGRGEAWRPYRTVATWYLWRSLEPGGGEPTERGDRPPCWRGGAPAAGSALLRTAGWPAARRE